MRAQRKKYLINKKFQLRTTFSLIAISSIFFALVVTVAGITLLDFNKRISNMIQINKVISDTLSAPVAQTNPREYDTYVKMQNNLDQNKKNLDSMIQVNMTLIIIIIGAVIIQGAALFFILIRQTHRIAGPIFVMTSYMRQIAEGKIPEHVRALRKNDFFKENYAVFEEMVNYLRTQGKKR